MKRLFPLLVLVAGCSYDPAGLSLLFPTEQDRNDANSAAIYIAPSGTDGGCTELLKYPPHNPSVGEMRQVTLVMGKPQSTLKDLPTGSKLIYVAVSRASGLFLVGCVDTALKSEAKIKIELRSSAAPVDMSVVPDLTTQDFVTPPDMTALKTLAVTVGELRAPTRRLQGATVTVADATGSASGTTDVSGVARVNTAALTPPFRVTAVAMPTNGYSGFTSISNLTPTFTNDAANLTLHIELDPPLLEAGNTIQTTTVAASDIYWVAANGVPSDRQKLTVGSATTTPVQPLTMSAAYRIGIVQQGTDKAATHGSPVISAGGTYNPMSGDYQTFATTFTGTITGSGTYTGYEYWVNLSVPVSLTQLVFPLFGSATAAVGAQTGGKVPAMAASLGVAGTKVLAEAIGTGATGRFEQRFELAATSETTHTFPAPPDPPSVTTPAAVPAAMPQVIMASAPTNFPVSTSYIHVTMKDGTDHVHGHLLQVASATANVTVPGNSLPAGSYTTDVKFVQPFAPANTAIPATLLDDWTKLTRKLPQLVSQSTITVTVQ